MRIENDEKCREVYYKRLPVVRINGGPHRAPLFLFLSFPLCRNMKHFVSNLHSHTRRPVMAITIFSLLCTLTVNVTRRLKKHYCFAIYYALRDFSLYTKHRHFLTLSPLSLPLVAVAMNAMHKHTHTASLRSGLRSAPLDKLCAFAKLALLKRLYTIMLRDFCMGVCVSQCKCG